jgi:hypothetical protein
MHVYKFKVVDFSRHFHVHFLVNTFEGPRFLSTFLFVFELYTFLIFSLKVSGPVKPKAKTIKLVFVDYLQSTPH